MTEFLRYDLDERHQLQMDVPRELFDVAMEQTRLPEIISHPSELVSHRTTNSGELLTFQKHPFENNFWDSFDVEDAVSHWLYPIVKIRQLALRHHVDPSIDIRAWLSSPGDLSGQGRIPLGATMSWPVSRPEEAAHYASTVMQEMGITLGYLTSDIVDAAHALIDVRQGVELQALDIACSCVGTDGMQYQPEHTSVEIDGHNLYNRQLVITCIAGLVAVAKFRP